MAPNSMKEHILGRLHNLTSARDIFELCVSFSVEIFLQSGFNIEQEHDNIHNH
jgi:hypothetical protein